MTQAEEFAKELEALIQKYGVIRREYDNYDGMEEYCGTTYELKFPDYSTFDNEEMMDVLKGKDPFRP